MRDPRTSFKDQHTPKSMMQCRAAVTGVHKTPEAGSLIDDQLLFGQSFHVAHIDQGWAYGQVIAPVGDAPGYVGYVRVADLSDECFVPSHKVTALKAPLFSRADIKSPVLDCLSLGSLIAGEAKDDFFKTEEGYIHSRHIAALTDDAEDFVSVAQGYIGLPYIWGGKSSDGVDCSGLVQSALWAAGIDCPRDADQQEAQLGAAVDVTPDLNGLQRGDLVFWRGHVGIMLGVEILLHANAHHMMTVTEPLAQARARIKTKMTAKSPNLEDTGSGGITAIKRLSRKRVNAQA